MVPKLGKNGVPLIAAGVTVAPSRNEGSLPADNGQTTQRDGQRIPWIHADTRIQCGGLCIARCETCPDLEFQVRKRKRGLGNTKTGNEKPKVPNAGLHRESSPNSPAAPAGSTGHAALQVLGTTKHSNRLKPWIRDTPVVDEDRAPRLTSVR